MCPNIPSVVTPLTVQLFLHSMQRAHTHTHTWFSSHLLNQQLQVSGGSSTRVLKTTSDWGLCVNTGGLLFSDDAYSENPLPADTRYDSRSIGAFLPRETSCQFAVRDQTQEVYVGRSLGRVTNCHHRGGSSPSLRAGGRASVLGPPTGVSACSWVTWNQTCVY